MKEFDRLVEVVSAIRKKCPWDREQDHATLKPYMLEEVHEAIEAIDNRDFELLEEELGDMLLHIIMHAEMAKEKKRFNIQDVIRGITKKMMRRHPHVFGKGRAKTVAGVLRRWKQIKREEKRER
ncbi:MAG: MazG nucleotide pyrophosphohydrolase domain-containing protein [Candidatus Margulisiibacteriota bacterium]